MENHKIPRHGKAGVAFAGATLAEAAPLIASIFIALGVGYVAGWMGYLGVPLLGYIVSKSYVEWKKGRLPGHLAVVLYKRGLVPFSRAFDKRNKVFVGNSVVINPGSKGFISAVRRPKNAAGDAE
jgi:hypothetical protein